MADDLDLTEKEWQVGAYPGAPLSSAISGPHASGERRGGISSGHALGTGEEPPVRRGKSYFPPRFSGPVLRNYQKTGSPLKLRTMET